MMGISTVTDGLGFICAEEAVGLLLLNEDMLNQVGEGCTINKKHTCMKKKMKRKNIPCVISQNKLEKTCKSPRLSKSVICSNSNSQDNKFKLKKIHQNRTVNKAMSLEPLDLKFGFQNLNLTRSTVSIITSIEDELQQPNQKRNEITSSVRQMAKNDLIQFLRDQSKISLELAQTFASRVELLIFDLCDEAFLNKSKSLCQSFFLEAYGQCLKRCIEALGNECVMEQTIEGDLSMLKILCVTYLGNNSSILFNVKPSQENDDCWEKFFKSVDASPGSSTLDSKLLGLAF